MTHEDDTVPWLCAVECGNDHADGGHDSDRAWHARENERRVRDRARHADPLLGWNATPPPVQQPHVSMHQAAEQQREGGSESFDRFASAAYFNAMRRRQVDIHYGDGTAQAIVDAGVEVSWIFFKPGSAGIVQGLQVGPRSDGAIVRDRVDALQSTRDSVQEIMLMMTLAKAKGWTTVNLKGSAAFCADAMSYAKANGLSIGTINGAKPTPRLVAVPSDNPRRAGDSSGQRSTTAEGRPRLGP